jgi:hypothetical protein
MQLLVMPFTKLGSMPTTETPMLARIVPAFSQSSRTQWTLPRAWLFYRQWCHIAELPELQPRHAMKQGQRGEMAWLGFALAFNLMTRTDQVSTLDSTAGALINKKGFLLAYF